MEFFRIRKDIPFMRHALVFNVISLVTFVLAVFFLFTRGLHLGVEFTGGTVMEVNYGHEAQVANVRATLEGVGLGDAVVQSFGSSQTVLIRLPAKQDVTGAQLSENVIKALRTDDPTVQLRRVDYVGSQVGRELVENGALANVVQPAMYQGEHVLCGVRVRHPPFAADRHVDRRGVRHHTPSPGVEMWHGLIIVGTSHPRRQPGMVVNR